MSSSINAFSYKQLLGFGVSLITIALLASCSKEELSTSIDNVLIGEWFLTYTNGGFVGEVNYTEADSPESITFSDGTFVRSRRSTSQLDSGAYQIQNVMSQNDTTYFDFGDDPASVFYGQNVEMTESKFLETSNHNVIGSYLSRYEKK